MNNDRDLRLLLGLIVVCLVLLVAQGFGLGAGRADSQGRYRISVIKAKKPWLMRVDTVTGQVEQLQIQGKSRWETLGVEEIDLQGAVEEDLDSEEPGEVPPPRVASRAPVAARPEPTPPPDAEPDVDDLVQSLQPTYPREIRVWAAELLGTYAVDAPETSVPALVAALDDPEPAVVIAAARSLTRSSSPEALAALRGLQDHPNPQVRATARRAVAAAE